MIQSLKLNQEFDISFKARITPFIILQLLRTKKFRKKLDDYYGPFYKNYIPLKKRENINNPIPETFKHAEAIFNMKPQIDLLMLLVKYTWVIGISESEEPFLSSDAPVVKFSHTMKKINNSLDFNDHGIEIVLPLTPTAILTLCDPEYFAALARNDCMCLLIDEQSIRTYNSLQFENADRFVFSKTNINVENIF